MGLTTLRVAALGLGCILSLAWTGGSSGAPTQRGATYLGTIDQHPLLRSELDAKGSSMFRGPRAAYMLVHRTRPSTSVYLSYYAGRRSVYFEGLVAKFRILASPDMPITIEASANGRICFKQSYRLRPKEVWEVRIPC